MKIVDIKKDMANNVYTFINYNGNEIFIKDFNTIQCFEYETHRDICFNLFLECEKCNIENTTLYYNWTFIDGDDNILKVCLNKIL